MNYLRNIPIILFKSRISIWVSLVFLILQTTSNSLYAQTYIFNDDFERPDVGPDWSLDFCGNSIQIESGRLHIVSTSNSLPCEIPGLPRAMIIGPELTDVTIQFDYDGGPLIRANNQMSVFARYNNPSSFYRANIHRDNLPGRQTVSISNESIGSIAELEVDLAPGRYEFSVIGNQLTFKNVPASGTPFILTVTDNELTSGIVGFATNEAPEIYIDNISVQGVRLLTTEEVVENMIEDIEGLENDGVLNGGQANALISKLENALKSIDKGNINAAINKIEAFINQVNDFINEQILTEAQGQSLITAAELVIADLMLLEKNSQQLSNTNSNLLNKYILEHNFPNPFNPSTVIKYQIPTTGFVTLKVYDVLGNEMASLVAENKEPGSYDITFDAAALSSGVYIYQLGINDYLFTKKMVLMK